MVRAHACKVRACRHLSHAGMRVEDAAAAFRVSTARGAAAVLFPVTLTDAATGTSLVVAEILLYPGGDVVLRFISGAFEGPFLPGYVRTDAAVLPPAGFGLRRVDHINIASEHIGVDMAYITGILGACMIDQLYCMCLHAMQHRALTS